MCSWLLYRAENRPNKGLDVLAKGKSSHRKSESIVEKSSRGKVAKGRSELQDENM